MDMRGCTRHAEHEICLFLRVLDGLEAPWIKAYRGLHVTMRRDQVSSTLQGNFSDPQKRRSPLNGGLRLHTEEETLGSVEYTTTI